MRALFSGLETCHAGLPDSIPNFNNSVRILGFWMIRCPQNQRFGQTYCLYLQGLRVCSFRNVDIHLQIDYPEYQCRYIHCRGDLKSKLVSVFILFVQRLAQIGIIMCL
jgi:hypothetical protein